MSQTQKAQGSNWVTLLGTLAFFVGMILSVIFGFLSSENGTVTLILVILGIIVGLLNITTKEVMPFLVAAIALVVAANTNIYVPIDKIIPNLGLAIDGIVAYIATFMVPAAIINAVRMVWSLAKPGE